ncbi:MAG TPA: hypothetical protein VJT67_13175 [Longimicrobiaceae bacterium]|nr:hypothetical protein [Longimicrobiaceae bacterium]
MRSAALRTLLPLTLWLFSQTACGGDSFRDGDPPPEADPPRLNPSAASFDALDDSLPPLAAGSQVGEPKLAKPEDAGQGERCDPNYTPCVPMADDVDCAGGRGDGPAYVQGPVRVIGADVYRLDGDHDGIACDH